jgi:hypothetical protein
MINLKNWFSSPCFDRTLKLGRLEVQARMRRNDGFMGRFGGGWNWELGFQIGRRCLLINLLVMSVRFTYTEEK